MEEEGREDWVTEERGSEGGMGDGGESEGKMGNRGGREEEGCGINYGYGGEREERERREGWM